MQNSKIKNRKSSSRIITNYSFIKNFAREFNIPIIALSQLSRNVENRIDKKPVLSDLRESGSIEQDADLVLMLYRNNNYNLTLLNQKIRTQLTELILQNNEMDQQEH
jgi:replicative DNA helicase